MFWFNNFSNNNNVFFRLVIVDDRFYGTHVPRKVAIDPR